MLTLTSTSEARFAALVEALSTVHEPDAAEATRIAATLVLCGVVPAPSGAQPARRETWLPDVAFDALVAGLLDAQARPVGRGSRIVLTLFGFGIAPQRIRRPEQAKARR